MTTDDVTYEVADRVATLSFNHPDKRNSWSPELEAGLRAAMDRATTDDGVRAIVLTGRGKAFCVGASMQTLTSRAASGTGPARPPRRYRDLEQRYSYIMAVPKPVIAAINGGIAGVGFCLSLYCDIRFMSDTARLSTAFARRGLVAEHGSSWMLPRLIGPMNAMDLLLSARTVGAEECEKLGLVRRLPAEGFLEAVQAYAAELANFSSPRSMRLIKEQVWDSHKQSLTEAVHRAEEEIDLCRSTEDYREGSAHFVEKRAPNFTGR